MVPDPLPVAAALPDAPVAAGLPDAPAVPAGPPELLPHAARNIGMARKTAEFAELIDEVCPRFNAGISEIVYSVVAVGIHPAFRALPSRTAFHPSPLPLPILSGPRRLII
jgi:hypothetical protein